MAFAAATIVGLSSCTEPANPIPVGEVLLLPLVDSLEVGQTNALFAATVLAENGVELRGRKVIWNSLHPNVATVDSEGRVSGIAAGLASITATSDGTTATATVKILVPVAQIIVGDDSVNVAMTTTLQLHAQLLGPSGQALAGRVVTWSTASSSIATVSTDGVVTPIAVGNTVVSAKAGALEEQIRIYVVREPVRSVDILPLAPVQVIRLGQQHQLTATCMGILGPLTDREILWLSDNPQVATVTQSGLVTGVSTGSARITASCDERSSQVTIQVTPVPVASATISPTQVVVFEGDLLQLSVTARDSANNVLSLAGRQVSWFSDNVPIATVSGQGVVQGVAQGNAQIHVSVDGVDSPSIPVTVNRVPVFSVTVSPNPGNVTVNQVLPLSVELRDQDGNFLSGRDVIWRSLNGNVATVSATGIVSGKVAGQAIIEAESEGVIGSALINVNNPPPE